MCPGAYEVFFPKQEENYTEDMRNLMSREIFVDPENMRSRIRDSYFLTQMRRNFGSLERDPRMKIYSQETQQSEKNLTAGREKISNVIGETRGMNKSTTEANPYMFNHKSGVDGSMYIVEEKSPKISSKKDLASERVNFPFRLKQIGSEQQICQYYGECYFQFAGT